MKYAKIANGMVADVIVADAAFIAAVTDTYVQTDIAGIGWTYANGVFTPPVPAPLPPALVDPTQWLIDIGPFYDRFGAVKMAVLTSADPGVVAIRSDVSIRKWIDLKRTDVAQSLSYIGSKVPSLTVALQASILTNPVTPEENLALRKLYFP